MCDFIHVRCDEKRDFIETILVVTILLTDLLSVSIHGRERIITGLWVLFRCLLYSRHVRSTQKEQINNHIGIVQSLTILMMSDDDEEFDDFPTFSAENISKQADSMVGAYHAKSTDQWTAATGITAKIPPLFDGPTPWFRYAELIDDWLNLTVLEARKRRAALKNRLVGDAEMHKELLNRESLKAEDGVKYFQDTLRPHFIKGAQTVFLCRFYAFIRGRRGNVEMVKWIGKFSLLLKRRRDAGMDMLPCPP